MLGKDGAANPGVLFIWEVSVKERIFSDGKLLPCLLKDVTVISYMVKGVRLSTVVEFWSAGTYLLRVK